MLGHKLADSGGVKVFFFLIDLAANGILHLRDVLLGENVITDREASTVLDTTQSAFSLRPLVGCLIYSEVLGHVKLSLFLLGTGILKPHLNHSLWKSNVIAKYLTFQHSGSPVVVKTGFQHFELEVSHLGTEALLARAISAVNAPGT